MVERASSCSSEVGEGGQIAVVHTEEEEKKEEEEGKEGLLGAAIKF